MGSFSHGIADAIRRMGDAQAQGALQKGAVYGNLAHDLGQAPMQYLAIDRGLHENKYRQTMQAAQEKKLKDDQEFEALINQTPPGPERLKVSLEFWQGRDPEKYHALVTGAYQAATQAVGAQQGRPGEPKLTPDPISGEPTQIDQQTAHAPVQFPGAYGQEPFSVTPQTDTQVAEKTSLQKYMDSLQQEAGRRAGGAGLDAAATRAVTVSEGEKNRENQRTLEDMRGKRPRTDMSVTPFEAWREQNPGRPVSEFLKLEAANRPAPATATVTIQTKDANGNPITRVLTKEEALRLSQGGQGIERPPAAMTQNRIVAARNSLSMGDELIAYLDKPEVKAALGPLMGRVTGWQGLVGNIPPELGELKGIIKSWSELQPAVHGMRSSEMAEDIERSAPTHWTPEALKGFIKGFQRTAKTVANSETSGAGTATPAPTGGGGTNRRISDKSDEELERITRGLQ